MLIQVMNPIAHHRCLVRCQPSAEAADVGGGKMLGVHGLAISRGNDRINRDNVGRQRVVVVLLKQ
ncbi:MAG: hypothetical protein BRC36_15175 [Cyanobacteria bacterium QH_2_48_84]|nr:MAG: hypothetical protein BRC36_15175 [Cyanobacteria bacterium QH_2_48_84]